MTKNSLFILFCGVALQAQNVWFEPNVGQVKGQTEWVGHSKGAYLYITGNEVVYANKTNTHMRLIGASPHARVEGMEPTGGYSNYFTGRDEKTWFTGIPHYARLKYRDVYPGIDLVYYGSGHNAEYDFIVKPGANLDKIELAFSEPVKLDHGDLVVAGLRQHRPRVIQDGREIVAGYRLTGSRVSFALSNYDYDRVLTIDPILEFSTYLGGPGEDRIERVVVDSAGFIYLAGATQSPAAPTLNPFQQTNIVGLAPFVFKLTADGRVVVSYTVLGNNGYDLAVGLGVDASGSAVITGETRSANFPLKNAFDQELKSAFETGFITKLSPDARSLVYSSYIGGSVEDMPYDLALDSAGNAHIAGVTRSHDFPVKNSVQPVYGGGYNDGFIVKVSPQGNVIYSTYYGGSGYDFLFSIAVAPDGSVIAGGGSTSADFPLKNALQGRPNPENGYTYLLLAKIPPDGQSIALSTFFGGNVGGYVRGLSLDSSGFVYAAGVVSPGFLTKNAYQSSAVAASAFLAKFDPFIGNVIFATYLGGSGRSDAYRVAVDANGSAFVTGSVSSADFPSKNTLQPFRGGGINDSDCFLTKFVPSGGSLVYSTFFGGGNLENDCSVGLDTSGNAYLVGLTASADLLIKNAFQSQFGGATDGFLAKISDQTPAPPSTLSPSIGSVAFTYALNGTAPQPQTISVVGGAFIASTSASWAVPIASGPNVSISVNPIGFAPGTYHALITLTPPAGTPATVDVALTILAPRPVLASVSPTLVLVGSDDTDITILGTGFTQQTTLQIDGLPWTLSRVVFISSSTLKVTLPKGFFSTIANHTIAAQNPQSALSNVLSVAVGVPAPYFTAESVTNAASFVTGPVAPGEIVTIFGTNLVGNVTFDYIPATIVSSRPTQISATVPYAVAGVTTMVRVGSSAPVTVNVVQAAPGIFAAVANGDGTLTLYTTGCGQLTQDALPLCQLPVSATVNGEQVRVLYAGVAPGLVEGANQVNIELPAGTGAGTLRIVLAVTGVASQEFDFTFP